MKALRFLFLLIALPACVMAADAEYTVAHVINGKSFTISTGDVVRLASIEAPNAQEENTAEHAGHPGEPLGEEAKKALATLIEGKTITLHATTDERDRHNRLLGQAYVGTVWVQGALLNQGFAMADSFADTGHDITLKMLAEERIARDAKRGIWGHPYYRVITPAETDEFINRFKLVEGKVVSVHEVHGNTYINFFDQWKGRFAIFISHKHAELFANAKLNELEGKTIRVRGWIHYHNAPMISITHPDEIEVE